MDQIWTNKTEVDRHFIIIFKCINISLLDTQSILFYMYFLRNIKIIIKGFKFYCICFTYATPFIIITIIIVGIKGPKMSIGPWAVSEDIKSSVEDK